MASSKFKFPYEPYSIQEKFMETLFNTLEQKKLGIFESPTGTGKSLSLICGSLSWLLDYNKREKEELNKIIEENEEKVDENSDDWFSSATKKIEKDVVKREAKIKLEKIQLQEQKIQNLKLKTNNAKNLLVKNLDNEFDELFKDLNQVREDVKNELHFQNSEDEITCDEVDFILNTDELIDDETERTDEEEDFGLKIYYCSRTHSQLSQFIKEVQKTDFRTEVRVAPLASRQILCINEAVLKLSNLSLINEKCLDMQNNKSNAKNLMMADENQVRKKRRVASAASCPFNKQTSVQNVSNQILLEVQDLEQLVGVSEKLKGCPYYASRNSVKDAQLVVVPYQSLLHKGTREASNLKLKNNIVIIDEAHNLLETIANIHSVVIYYGQLCGALSQLSQYLQRYEKRLSPQNLLNIRQIIFFLQAYVKLLTRGNGSSEGTASNLKMMTLQQLLYETLTDNLNIFKLIQYTEKCKLAKKLHGFCQMFEGKLNHRPPPSTPSSVENASSFLVNLSNKNLKQKRDKVVAEKLNTAASEESSCEFYEHFTGSPLLNVVEFMKAITCGSSDGRVIVKTEKISKNSFIKFILLNPASQFHEIVRQCRSVIVAGGTMAPLDEFKHQLFLSSGADPERIIEFSCSHVVPKENILGLVLKEGPGGHKLDFTFNNRNDAKLLDDLGRILVNICNVVPGGVVVFFPSYEYEIRVSKHFDQSGILNKLQQKKRLFREPKKANELDKVLSEYSKSVKDCTKQISEKLNGAIIFSIVGGKMSEGINFSDDLGRCVVMVGLPYPNSTSCELREKMTYLDQHYPHNADGKSAGAAFYENLCFKAVNQSIGRSIRHRGDYASILLLDHRYSNKNVMNALPKWISASTRVCDKFGPAFGSLRKFFADKKENFLADNVLHTKN